MVNGTGVSIQMDLLIEKTTKQASGNAHITTEECAWKSSKDCSKLHLRLARNLPFEAFLQLTIVENAIVFAEFFLFASGQESRIIYLHVFHAEIHLAVCEMKQSYDKSRRHIVQS